MFEDSEGLLELYLELVDAYKKKFMPQNGQVAILKCSPIMKKMRKSFKALSVLKAQVFPQKEAWKRKAMAHRTPLKRCSLKINSIKTNSTLFFYYLSMSIWFSCLKTWVDVSWLGSYLCCFFFQLRKRKMSDNGGYLCQAWRNVAMIICDKAWWWVVGGSKKSNFSVT